MSRAYIFWGKKLLGVSIRISSFYKEIVLLLRTVRCHVIKTNMLSKTNGKW